MNFVSWGPGKKLSSFNGTSFPAQSRLFKWLDFPPVWTWNISPTCLTSRSLSTAVAEGFHRYGQGRHFSFDLDSQTIPGSSPTSLHTLQCIQNDLILTFFCICTYLFSLFLKTNPPPGVGFKLGGLVHRATFLPVPSLQEQLVTVCRPRLTTPTQVLCHLMS